nr:oxygen-independent coproporphyrinogen III oxidase [Aestuariivirga litoralis]
MNIAELLARQPSGLPRYTSYPPANHFEPDGGPALLGALVAAASAADKLSLYIHIPYCDRICWFCGCHTKQTMRYEPVADYVKVLVQEIALWGAELKRKVPVSALHLGGGSPSLLRREELQMIKEALHAAFDFSQTPEISIEIDPSDVKDGTIADLMSFGMTRASIGVQDFDPAVQAAINRPQSFELTRDVVRALRAAGIQSINIDALYGLPLQDTGKLALTLKKVLNLEPDRIALFGYAHVPWMKPHQRLIDEKTLPDSAMRLQQAEFAANVITDFDYRAIGIDHFAKPGDTLALAAKRGRLHRNFQGYSDDDASVRLGFGPSSIGCFPGGYVQNEVATGRYATLVQTGRLALARGLALSDDDRMRSFIIERLLCDFAFSFDELVKCFGVSALPLISQACGIAAGEYAELCWVDDAGLHMTDEARPVVRIIAAQFDTWLKPAEQRYSKVV